MTVSDPQWTDIDPWWERVSRVRTGDLEALEQILDELDTCWATRSSVFDTDPLSMEWDSSGPQGGPLRTNQEENWSQWLAHLLYSAPDEFYSVLFESAPSGRPTQVRCEVGFGSDSDHDRRADIVVETQAQGISIEVKIDDVAYSKTPETASLIENRMPSLEWSHYLLLPSYKRKRLAAVLGNRYIESDGDRSAIRDSEFNIDDVRIRYWEDVSFALRRTLLGDTAGNAHWQASAYLFITHIEQHLCRFYPRPAIERQVHAPSSLGVSDLTQLQTIDPERQRDYLTKLLEVSKTND